MAYTEDGAKEERVAGLHRRSRMHR
jgi:hypothetical protein